MRLKISNLNNAIKQLSGGELSLYIYITQRADRTGLLHDLSMKQTCLKTSLSKQHFYNCLYALEVKGFLHISQAKSIGFDILLVDNKFLSEDDASDPYMNLHYSILNSLVFHKLSISMKKFILRALSFSNKHKWNVSEDMLKSYKLKIEDLSRFFKVKSLGLNKKKDRHFNIQFIREFSKVDKNLFYLHYHHRLTKFLSKQKIAYTLESLNDSIQVLSNYRQYQSLAGLGLEQMKDKFLLQPKLLNYIVNIHKNSLHPVSAV